MLAPGRNCSQLVASHPVSPPAPVALPRSRPWTQLLPAGLSPCGTWHRATCWRLARFLPRPALHSTASEAEHLRGRKRTQQKTCCEASRGKTGQRRSHEGESRPQD